AAVLRVGRHAIQRRDHAFDLPLDERGHLGWFRPQGHRHIVDAVLDAALHQPLRESRDERVRAEHQDGAHDEHAERNQRGAHYRTSVIPSNMSGGRWMPLVFRRSATFGRTPVALKRPMTLPSCVIPSFSNRKISCMVMTSPSM